MSHETWTGGYDTLASDSTIRLFGRVMWDIVLKQQDRRPAYDGPDPADSLKPPALPPRLSRNSFLVEQLSKSDANLARIYSFSYHNELFDLTKPAIFVVHGKGTDIELPNDETTQASRYLRKLPTFADRSGLAGQRGSFALDLKVWLYDRADFTVRLDTESGTFDQVLLDYELGGGVGSGSMHAADADDPPPQTRRRRRFRRWRSGDD